MNKFRLWQGLIESLLIFGFCKHWRYFIIMNVNCWVEMTFCFQQELFFDSRTWRLDIALTRQLSDLYPEITVHIGTHLLKIYLNIVFPSIHTLSFISLSQRFTCFPTALLVSISKTNLTILHCCYMPCHPDYIRWTV